MAHEDYSLGATFMPGIDDYYMPAEQPDVLSPTPQRVQDNPVLSELDAAETEARTEPLSTPPTIQAATLHEISPLPPPNFDLQSQFKSSTSTAAIQSSISARQGFSGLPIVNSRPSNVPPSIAEHEAVLETARETVVTSSDPDVQLAWAEDAVLYADNCTVYRSLVTTDKVSRAPTPSTERQLRVEAINIVNFLANQGHPKAEFLRGMWLEFGKFGSAQSRPEAFRCYKRSASRGYARSEYRMGLQYESTGEPMKALRHYKAGEALGDSASCYRVGMMLLLGQLGQAQDLIAGIRLIKYSADTADANASQGSYVYGMLLVGELHQVNVPQQILQRDEGQARTYIEKAAFLGFARAQLKMGFAYELCSLNCTFDPILAVHYMSLAARQGQPEADMALCKWFLCGYEDLFPKDHGLAYQHASRAAAAKLNTAQFALGYFSEVGIHVPVNLEIALEWYQKAAEGGNKDAPGRLRAITSSQVWTRKDHEQVAIPKMRSQYGSQRQPNLQVTSPNYGAGSSNPSSRSSSAPGFVQGRRTPYPISDRPSTTAPYPLAGVLSSDATEYTNANYSRTSVKDTYPHTASPIVSPPHDSRDRDAASPESLRRAIPRKAAINSSTLNGVNPAGKAPRQNFDASQSERKHGPDRANVNIGFLAPVDPRADRLNRPPVTINGRASRASESTALMSGARNARFTQTEQRQTNSEISTQPGIVSVLPKVVEAAGETKVTNRREHDCVS